MRMVSKVLAGILCGFILLAAIAETKSQTVSQNLGIYARAPRGQLPGATDNTVATAGNIGEPLAASRAQGSAQALTDEVALSQANISVTAGNWIIGGSACFVPGATTTVNQLLGMVSSTINSISGLDETNSGRIGFGGAAIQNSTCVVVPTRRVSVTSGSTTYYITTYADFATSTMTGYGSIWAVRIN